MAMFVSLTNLDGTTEYVNMDLVARVVREEELKRTMVEFVTHLGSFPGNIHPFTIYVRENPPSILMKLSGIGT